MTDPVCVASWRTRDGLLAPQAVCGKPAVHEVADMLVCDYHYKRALEWAEKAARWANSIVYYVQRADSMIKIGTSRATASRFDALAREHGRLVLMAFHTGARAEETAMHRRFKTLHIGREWFRPELPLLEHIRVVRKTMGNLEYENDGLPRRMSRPELTRLIRETRAKATG